jgi:hypothetical protein
VAFWDRLFSRLRAFLGEPLDKSLRRRLRAAAPAKISELREGLHCRIAGIVRPLDQGSLEAPLCGLPCVAYLLEVVEQRLTDVGTDRDLVVYDRKTVPFLLVDGEHRALVDPSFAQILLTSDHELTAASPHELSPRARSVLETYAPMRKDWSGTLRLTFRESIVEVGDRIAIAGVGKREADPHSGGERGYRDEVQQRLRFAGSQALPLLIGSDPP